MENGNLLSIHKAKKLLEANKMLTRSLRLDEILKNLIHVASELIDVPGVIIIYLYDHKTNTLRFAGGSGINEKYFKKVSFAPGESITGKVFNERKSKLFISEDEIDEYMSDMSEKNFKYYFKGTYTIKLSKYCLHFDYRCSRFDALDAGVR